MKSKFLRMLSMILILSFLISMLSVFAFAEDEIVEDEEEKEEETSQFELLYNRTYDEGWDVANGFNYTANGSMATTFEIEYETTLEYDYNYFWRLEIGAEANSFMQLNA